MTVEGLTPVKTFYLPLILLYNEIVINANNFHYHLEKIALFAKSSTNC